MPRLLKLPLLALTLVACAACGGGTPPGTGIKVKGTLVQNGKPLQPAPKEDDTMQIVFRPAGQGNLSEFAAIYNHADGTFEFFKGRTANGVEPGDYRLVLSWVPYAGNSDDVFREQFTADNSPLKYTVTTDKLQEIVVDVGKRTVTKGQ